MLHDTGFEAKQIWHMTLRYSNDVLGAIQMIGGRGYEDVGLQ